MINTVRVNADHGRDFHPLADHGRDFPPLPDHGRDFHPLADHMTKLRHFTAGEIREFSEFPSSLHLMLYQTLI